MLKITVKDQGQTFPLLFTLSEPTKIHYHLKLQQNRTSNFQIIGNLPTTQNTKMPVVLKVTCHKNPTISKVHHNMYSYHVTSISHQ